MWEVWQLENIVKKEAKLKDWIDRNEVLELNRILKTDENNQLDEKVKEEFNKKNSINTILNWVNKFLNNPNSKKTNLELLSSDYLKSYKNILKFLNDSVNSTSTWDKKDQFSEQEKKDMTNQISSLLASVDKQLKIKEQEDKIVQDKINEKNLEIKWESDFINMIKNWILNAGKDGNVESVFANSDLVSKTLNMFIEQYNSNNTEKLTRKDLTSKMQNIPNERKDIFSWYFSQIIVASKKDITLWKWITNYRKSIYPLLFKEWDNVQLLLSQKRIIVWDRSSTQWMVPGYKENFWVNLFNYNEGDPWHTTTSVDWLSWQKTLNIWFLASWVDLKWATIIVKVGDTKITWITQWVKATSSNKTDQNIIKWSVAPWNNPQWLTIENWSIKIDSEKYWSRPIVAVDVFSNEKDEVFVTTGTDGIFVNKNSIATNNDISQQENFNSWERNLSEIWKQNFDKQILSIKEVINNRLPNWTNLNINIWSWVDNVRVTESLTKNLITAVDGLKKDLKWYEYLITDMESKCNNGKFTNEWNKLLAQARFLTWVKYMVDNLKKDPKYTNTYLDKVLFKVTKIEQTKTRRYFDFEMWKYVSKSTPQTNN